MKPRAKIGAAAKIALVGGAALGEAVEGRKTGAHAGGLVQACGQRPGGDDFVADIFVDFAAGLGDGQRQVGDESVEEVQKAFLAYALSDRCGGAHVGEEQKKSLTPREGVALG